MPKDVANIRSFMGRTGYYQIFIERFSKISYLITSLQNKGLNSAWSLNCQESFENLTRLLTMTPILKMANPYKDYTVCTYSGKEGVGEYYIRKGMLYVTNIAN